MIASLSHSRSFSLRAGAILAWLLVSWMSGRAQAQDTRPAATSWFDVPAVVLPTQLTSDIEPERPQLVAAIVGGLRAAGLRVDLAPEGLALDEATQDCQAEACLTPLAARVRARFLVFSRIESRPREYTVLVRALDGKTARELGRSEVICAAEDPCPPMAETVLQVAKEAGQRTRAAIAALPAWEDSGASRPSPTQAATPPSETVTFAPPRVLPADEAAPKSGRSRIPLWLPVSSLAAGGVLIGVSAYLFAVDGDGVDCLVSNECLRYRDTRSEAIGVAVGAGVALASGAVLLWLRGKRNADVSVTDAAWAVTPWTTGARAGLSVSTRF